MEIATVASVAATPLSSAYTLADEFERLVRGGKSGGVFGTTEATEERPLMGGLGHGRVIRVTNMAGVDDDDLGLAMGGGSGGGGGSGETARRGHPTSSAQNVPRVMHMSEGTLRSILDSRAVFTRHVNMTSLCNTDEVSPWDVVNDVTEDILDGCINDVCSELGAELDTTINLMVAAETDIGD